jgi:predicted enzyme related to lactoylglutathione lyase
MSSATAPAKPAAAVKVTGIDVHTYLVKDPQRAIAFYRDAIGLPVTWQSEQGAEFQLSDGSTFGVWKMHDGTWHLGSGVMFSVPDLVAAEKLFRGRGVKMLDDEIRDTGGCYMLACQDSEGNFFLLHQRKEDAA